VMAYTTDSAGVTTWSAASSVTNDTVLEQEQTIYDGDSNAIETIDKQRFHNATGTGALGTPTSGVNARVYYAAAYYDNADRLIADVNAGTNGGTAWTRPSSVPASSATLLVTNYVYNAAGWVQDVIDPMGIDDRTNYDNLGRVTQTIQDYTNGTETTETNISTKYGYDGNDHVTSVQADEPGGSYQKTAYVYGVTTAGGNGVNSNDILSAVQHPDPTTGNPSSTQQDSYKVNALGQVVQATDRNGNVHQYTYDVLGRITSDAVTTLGTGVDGAIRRIQYAYDSQGNGYLITSYNAASGGSIVNQVQRVFNGLGQLTGEYQSHTAAVVQGTTPEVQYAYTEMSGGQNNSRLVSLTYPNSFVVNFNYNTGLDSNISRLSSIANAGTTLESYQYLGLSTVVEFDHPQTNINLTYIQQTGDPYANSDGGDQYTGLDRFGRVIDQFWINASNATTVDRYQYGYDQDSDVLWRQNLVNTAMGELYTYGNLNQLTSFARGTLNANKNGISGTPSRTQNWTPDALGNFTGVTTNGTAQTRTANQQNEYTSISGSGTITYDANGNTTADGSGNTFVYDAWNRLVAIKNGATTLASYSNDGLNRLIKVTDGSTTTDLYVSADQVLVEYQGSTATAYNVWSPVYVNALLFRDVGNGHMYTRYYFLHDANWNVTALVSISLGVQERYAYDPFGAVTVMSSSWVIEQQSAYNTPYGFQGMRYDWTVSVNFADNRVYSPALMRWLQTDPVGLNAGNNDYAMEGNGPTDAVDPSGEDLSFLQRFEKWMDRNVGAALGNA
jgi:RHS repeat-associated protein